MTNREVASLEERKFYLIDVSSEKYVSSETKELLKPILTDNNEECLRIQSNQISLTMFYLYNSKDSLYVSKFSKEGKYVLTSNKNEALVFTQFEIDRAWKVAIDVAWEQLGQFFVCGEIFGL